MKFSLRMVVFIGLLLVTFAVPTWAITLSQDFDSGSLDVDHSFVYGETVFLDARETWDPSYYQSKYRWVYFKASDVTGTTPLFLLNERTFFGDLTSHKFVYSYDQTNWNYFDNSSINENDTYLFNNDQPFTESEVYVAYSLPYPVSRVGAHLNDLAASPYLMSTAASRDGYVLGYGAGGVDDTGRTIPGQPVYGYKITDPTAGGDKAKVVLTGGNHSGEPLGNLVLEGMVDFLTSDDPVAVALREETEFYVYPMINADGRYAGYYRSEPERPWQDTNRAWDDPHWSTSQTVLRDAMISDTGGEVDYLIDFHQFFEPNQQTDHFYIESNDPEGLFQEALWSFESHLEEIPLIGRPGMLHYWATLAEGLSADFGVAAEFGARPGLTEADLAAYGVSYAKALYAVLVVPEPVGLIYGLAILAWIGVMRRGRKR